MERDGRIKLSKRLSMSASFVPKGSRTADVGCDHAYTAIWLAQNGIAEHVIAMDVNRGPLIRAQENIRRCGLEGRIETRLSDGLKGLTPGEADVILCAGMGGGLMVRILTEGKEAAQTAKHWILQPQSEIPLVRRYITQNRYRIEEEKMCQEEGKFYVSIHAVKREEGDAADDGRQEEAELGILFGETLLSRRDPVLFDYLRRETAMNERIRKALAGQRKTEEGEETLGGDRAAARLLEIEEKLVALRRALALFAG